jgi:TAG lipase / steryl ester hydrolase / phospholipase A2 / LPA acyltransferase
MLLSRSLPSPLSQKLRALDAAATYPEWREIAVELDRLEGAEAWKQDEASDAYDHFLIRERLDEMRRLRAAGAVHRLVHALHEGLHGNLGNITAPGLYAFARVGTKRLIEDYIAEVILCLEYVCDGDFPDFSEDQKIVFFKRTGTSFGRSALLLSGGATLGMFHLGVIKALSEENLLPRVISGSSAGAIIAGIVGTRTDAQLPQLFDGESLKLSAFQRLSLRKVLSGGGLMNPAQLEQCLNLNVGEETFTEAFQRTRRIIGVTVSAAEAHQQGRLLNYLTAPNVLMSRAILASCAVPGVFPPVQLSARDFEGQVVPYLPSKRWIDGTVYSDLPMLRLARLHNVNHYIVSQTNPHVVPFMVNDHAPERRLVTLARQLVLNAGRGTVRLARAHLQESPVRRVADQLNAVIAQRYSGDINILPQHTPRQLLRMFSNLDARELAMYIREGERATWPKLERIRNQSAISRCFERCTRALKDRHLQKGSGTRPPARARAPA